MILEILSNEMNKLNLNYGYMRYSTPQYPYFVGEYSDNEYSYEDERTEGEILLTGWSRNNFTELIDAKDLIKRHFANYKTIYSGTAVYIAYNNYIVIDSGEADLYKIEIRLSVKEWKGA